MLAGGTRGMVTKARGCYWAAIMGVSACGLVGGCEGAARSGWADGGPADVVSTMGVDSRPENSGRPLPPGVRAARRLLPPEASLTGDSLTSCSHQHSGGSSQHWCAFAMPTGLGAELWVVNVTRAAAGDIPACDGTSADCIRLTDRLWVGAAVNGPWHPDAHRFHGDTLLFYAQALSGPAQVHRGPVYAWRPGWARARKISSDEAMQCWAHDSALVAYCVENLAGDPERPDSFELRAGSIGDRDDIALATLGRVPARRADGRLAWQLALSPGGDVLAVSMPAPDPAVESLHVVPVGDVGTSLREIVRDAAQWQISHDGARIYFLREEMPDQQALFVADFPTGAKVTRLSSRVSEYQVLGGRGRDRGIGFITELRPGEEAFRLLRDPTMPDSARTVFSYQEMPMSRRVSPDGRFTAWADARFRLRVVEHEGLRSCDVNASPTLPAYAASFLEGGRMIFWAEDTGSVDRERRDGYFANPVGCEGKQRFARSIYFLAPVGDRGVVFADEVDDETQRATLKFAAIVDGARWPADGPVRVHEGIDGPSVVPASWDPLLLLFQVSSGPLGQQGIYLFGPVPF